MEPLGSILADQLAPGAAASPCATPPEGPDEVLPSGMWSIGGGKGGVGKSIVACSIAYWLGRMGRSVVLVDADLGGANLHTLLGIRVPKYTLEDFLVHRVESLEDVVLETPFTGVRLLAGGYDVAALANPNYGQKSRLIRALKRLHADNVIVDLGAGTSLNTLDFFLACQRRCAVLSPQPTSIQNAYGFIKSALYRQIARTVPKSPEALALLNAPSGSGRPTMTVPQIVDELAALVPERAGDLRAALKSFTVDLVVNMVQQPNDAHTGQVVQGVCKRYLGIDATVLAGVPASSAIQRWASTMDPACFIQASMDAGRQATHDIAMTLSAGMPKAA